jgi:hypothetical protein
VTRIDPNPMSGEELARGIAEGRHLPTPTISVAELADYEQRTYQVLINRGEPVAQAKERAAWWAKARRADPEAKTFIGPTDVLPADQGRPGSITTDPETGIKTYHSAYQPSVFAAATGLLASGPPVILEYTSNRWISMQTPVNRFSLNPGAEYYARIPGPAPQMFGGGTRDLPIVTAQV